MFNDFTAVVVLFLQKRMLEIKNMRAFFLIALHTIIFSCILTTIHKYMLALSFLWVTSTPISILACHRVSLFVFMVSVFLPLS